MKVKKEIRVSMQLTGNEVNHLAKALKYAERYYDEGVETRAFCESFLNLLENSEVITKY